MKTINLILGIHNHQPVGNFDSVFQQAFERAYQPFVELLERYPRVKLALHYSGILLEWLVQHQPQFIRRLKRLVDAGQVEMMGGAYYEAILSIIPDRDKSGQLDMLSKAIRKQFGHRPAGMWLAERVWEQHLAKYIADAGLRYTVVDDTHFKYAGFSEDELLGYYVTEEERKTIAIFPISKRLRYTIPFQPVSNTIDYLREIASEDGQLIAVYADDGEKFGVWPNTYDHVYTNGWLEEFFRALTDNADWIRVLHFSEALSTIAPLGRTYLPNASYAEMLHWALPAHHFPLYEEFETLLHQQGIRDKYESFFKGGFWRNFLAKYPESNMMHKKMLHVSERLQAFAAKKNGRLQASALARARSHLYAAQCNDPYWHGIFGGLYLPVLRYPIYHHLIRAEQELDRMERRTGVRTQVYDFDCDGQDEVIVESPTLNCYVKPSSGGALIECDYKPLGLNILDIVSRRQEGYHTKLRQARALTPSDQSVASIHDIVKTKEPGLEHYLDYDWYQHASLLDHFFAPATTLEQVWRSRYQELGDFVNRPYKANIRKEGTKTQVELRRDGTILTEKRRHRISIRKAITIDHRNARLLIDYSLRNDEAEPVAVWFGVEFNVGLQAGNAPDRYYYVDNGTLEDRCLRSMGAVQDVAALGLKDEWLGVDVRIEVDKPTMFWRFPIEVVSLSEEGFERIFQSSVVIPNWQFILEKQWTVRLNHSIKALPHHGRR